MKDVGLVGLPFSGTSTVFNAIARAHASTGGGAKKANIAVLTVPDPRVDELRRIYRSKKSTYAQIRLVDVPGLEPQSLAAARESDALAIVLRGFGGDADPARDLSRFRAELAVADLQTIERAIDRLRKQGKPDELEVCERAEAVLSSDRWLSEEPWDEDAARVLSLLTPITVKPALHVVNADESGGVSMDGIPEPHIEIRGLLEAEGADLDESEAASLLAEFGLPESATTRFVHALYRLLDLVTFFTAGEPEAAARPVRRGTTARSAAGEIHTDLEKGFIRAEVVSYGDLVQLGSLDAAREKGKLRVEGRDYMIREGDVALIRHSS